MFGLSYLRSGLLIAALFGGYLVYSWGHEIINNYSAMSAEIATLKRDKALITSRIDSYKTLLERRDAAIAASKCATSIQNMIKNPDTIPRKQDPFTPGGGG
jgi:hypothetical protein